MLRSFLRNILAPVGAAAFTFLLVMERRRPLRRQRTDRTVALVRNAELGTLTGLTIHVAFLPVMIRVGRLVESRRLGLLQRLPLPESIRTILAVILLDYTYYWWHYMLHRIPFLWRFHLVHHADLDMDVSTAIRFHFGEWLLSTPFRGLQAVAIGASERSVAVFELSMVLAILFHHSNLQLRERDDRTIARFVVSPRMHGIHHSVVREERDANFATLLTIWDRLHGTLRLDVPQERIDIGLPQYRAENELTIGRLIAMPFSADERVEDSAVSRTEDRIVSKPDERPEPEGVRNGRRRR